METERTPIGRRIAALRHARGLTQMALAERVGVKGGSVAGWEVGKAAPSRETLPRVADALGVSVDALLGRQPLDGPPSLPMRAGARFRAAREARGLSATDVARTCGYKTTVVERLETGALPDATVFAQLAARVGVSLDALFADDPEIANGRTSLRVDGIGGDDHGGASPAPTGGDPMPHVDPWVMLDRLTQSQADMAEAAKSTAQALQDFVRLADKREDNITAFREAALSHDADRPDAPAARAQNE